MTNYIVLDLEWNQSPEGKEGSVENFPFEIIEIGAVKLNEDREEIGTFQRLIKPKVYRQIHYKTSEVTHMDMAELTRNGQDFESAVQDFFSWCGADAIFCTWGSMDLMELQRNMAYYQIENPFAKPLLYYDVQKLYSILYNDGKEKQSLDVAVEEQKLQEERPFHRALDDAYYTGRIMKNLDFKKVCEYRSVDYYRLPKTDEEEIYLIFPDYSKYVSKTFETKEEAIDDKIVTDLVCYRCNRMLRKKIRWFSVNQKFYFALGYCPEHGYLKGKIRMKHADDGSVYVIKTLKLVDEEGAQLIEERKDEAKKKRVEKTRIRKMNKRAQ